MGKKLSHTERNKVIADWADNNKVILVSGCASFVSNKAPIYYQWTTGELQGLIGKTTFDSIITDIKPTVNGLTDASKQLRAERIYAEYGLQLLEPFTNGHTPCKVKILTGTYAGYCGELPLSAISQKRTRGKRKELNITILTDGEKKRYFDDFAQSRGYTVIHYPEKLAVRGKCTLLSPQGHEWETVWYHFAYQDNCNCPLDVKRSIGERMVSALLTANHIAFIEQYKVRIEDTNLFIDFYLPEYNIAIEYNGKQHYENTGGFYTGKLAIIQKRDQQKATWCRKNKVTLIPISYTRNTTALIAEQLKDYLSIETVDVAIDYADSIPPDVILAYYQNHTGNETAKCFGITKRQLGLMAQRAGFSKIKKKFNKSS